MGTTDNIFVLHSLINHVLNANEQLFCLFVDYSKAFDYLVRPNIWYKLYKLGLRGKLFNVIHCIYSSVKTKVKLFGESGEMFESFLGVRQGECLSPFIFSMYLNDLEDELFLNGAKGVKIKRMCLSYSPGIYQ